MMFGLRSIHTKISMCRLDLDPAKCHGKIALTLTESQKNSNCLIFFVSSASPCQGEFWIVQDDLKNLPDFRQPYHVGLGLSKIRQIFQITLNNSKSHDIWSIKCSHQKCRLRVVWNQANISNHIEQYKIPWYMVF